MMITSPTTGVNSQSWDYVNNYTDVQAWIPKNMVIVNKRAFRRLDKPVQSALLAAAAKAEIRGWKMAVQETTDKTEELAEHGMTVSEPSEILMTELKKVGEDMTAEWAEEAGSKGTALLKEYK